MKTHQEYTMDTAYVSRYIKPDQYRVGRHARDARAIRRGRPVNAAGDPVGPSEVHEEKGTGRVIRKFWQFRDGTVFREWIDDDGQWRCGYSHGAIDDERTIPIGASFREPSFPEGPSTRMTVGQIMECMSSSRLRSPTKKQRRSPSPRLLLNEEEKQEALRLIAQLRR